MSFPRYPNYKASGVEWLGEVPGHWGVTALKRGFNVTLGKMLQPESSGPDDELLPYLRAANIQWGGVDTSDIKKMWLSKRDRAQLRLERGDLLVSEGGDVGRTCLWAAELDDCYFQNSVNRVRARDGHSNRYLCYWMSTIKDKGYIDVLCNKSTIAHFTAEKVSAVPTPFPPPAEQTLIAEFLDRETAKIDGLVAEQRRLMELLKEKRQAVISHAVTQGLNPRAPMKPSYIEWLGDVPAHWAVISIKWLSPVKRGASPRPIDDPKYFDDEGEFAWVRIADVSACDGVLKETTQRLSELGSSLSVKIAPGELFVSIAGTVGKPCLSAIKACIHDGFVYFPTLKIDPKFLYRIFEEGTCYGGLGKWGTQLNLNTDTIGSIRVALPPSEELKEILAFLDTETAKLDTLTAEAQRAIDLLQERRTALISAAVTGQIDVRSFATVANA